MSFVIENNRIVTTNQSKESQPLDSAPVPPTATHKFPVHSTGGVFLNYAYLCN
jgi:hypothetical protein